VGLAEDSPLGRHIAERRGHIFTQRHLPMLRPTRGAAGLVRGLRARGLRIAVATSARPEELHGLLERAGVPVDLADRAASAEDVEASKPDPDVVHVALREIGLGPGEVVLVGDTPYDVEAGGRAGVPVVALRCGGWDDDELRGAALICDDPADLLDRLDEVLERVAAREPAGT
jgi:HAD superfamily hydrolase (TIGR01509 family)